MPICLVFCCPQYFQYVTASKKLIQLIYYLPLCHFLNVNRCSFFFFGGVFFPPLIRCPHSVCSWTFHQPKHTERTLRVAKLSYLVLYNSIQYSTQFSQPHCNCSIDLFQHQNDQHVQDDACGGDGHPHAGLGFRIGVHGPHA